MSAFQTSFHDGGQWKLDGTSMTGQVGLGESGEYPVEFSMKAIRGSFSGFKRVLNVCEASRPQVAVLDREETMRRRPQ